MNQTSIMYPVMGLVAWTSIVLLLVPYQRFKAVIQERLGMDDFKLGESERVPGEVSIPNRNYMNLLEMPILFYFVCFALYIFAGTDPLTLVLAWGYVALRVFHSLVHLTYNNVAHRVFLFATSNILLMVMWVLFFLVLGSLNNS